MAPARPRHPPAGLLVALGAISVQWGAALATGLFARIGPAGAVALRLVLGAAVLVAATRADPRRLRRTDLAAVAAFGVALAAMNLSFYEAIDRIPLGVAVTVEFVGPLAVALAGSRRLLDAVWALLAGAGVLLLGAAPGGHLDEAGVALALLAGGCWAGYILLSREVGRRVEGVGGLALAMVVAAVAITPAGVVAGGGHLLEPAVLERGLAVALLSSVVPYSLELIALRRVSPRAFGILLSIDPALAAAAGLVVLGQHLRGGEVVAVVLVVAANAGSALASSRRPAVPSPS